MIALVKGAKQKDTTDSKGRKQPLGQPLGVVFERLASMSFIWLEFALQGWHSEGSMPEYGTLVLLRFA